MACETCSPLYTWTPFNDGTGRCFRYNTLPSSPPEIYVDLVTKTNPQYSSNGGLIFSTYDSFGVNIGPTTPLNNSIWYPTMGNNGPMNRSSVWPNLVGSLSVIDLPLNVWVGFSVCLSGTSTSSKEYYVGIGANDAYRLILDGTEIVNTYYGQYNGTTEPYEVWHLYPITVGTGNHTLEIYGLNIDKNAAIGCEIYDNTLSELTNATVISDLNIVYSTSGETSVTIFRDLIDNYLVSGETCPRGYFYSDCDGTCKRIVVCEDLSLTPTPTSSVTPTPTPTITPTTTSRSLSRFIRSCCNDRLYRINEDNGLFTIGSVISIYPEEFCYNVVADPTINERYYSISIGLGYNVLDSCNDGRCQPCPTPTPTPTPSATPNSTPLPTPTYLPKPVEPIPGQSVNECGVLTLLELGIICNVINPTVDNPNGGVLSVYVTGGTAPYTIVWETPDGAFITGQTIYNQVGGEYTVTVYDKWRDFVATTTCSIVQPIDCEYDAGVSIFNLPTPTPTIPALTPSPTVTPTVTQSNPPNTKGRLVIVSGANNLVVTYRNQDGELISNRLVADSPPSPAFSPCIYCDSILQVISGTYTSIVYTQNTSCTPCSQPNIYHYRAETRSCENNQCEFRTGQVIVSSFIPMFIGSFAIPYNEPLPHSTVYKILSTTTTVGNILVQQVANTCQDACIYVPVTPVP